MFEKGACPFIPNSLEMITYDGYYIKSGDPLYKKLREPFYDNLIFKEVWSGRSSVRMKLFSKNTGFTYELFYKSFNKIIPEMQNGTIEGWFQLEKNGANYGLAFLGKELK